MPLNILWVGGSGGNWLHYLIHLLANGINDTKIVQRDHWHNKALLMNRYKDADLDPHSSTNGWYFNGTCRFNFYLNVVHKRDVLTDCVNKLPYPEMIEKFCSAASYTIEFPTTTNLNYKDLYQDPDKFIDDLFDFLDSKNFRYSKNREVCHAKIKEFKMSCVDAFLHLNNYSSDYWLGWCSGILKHKKISLNYLSVNSNTELAEKLQPYYSMFDEFTKDLTL